MAEPTNDSIIELLDSAKWRILARQGSAPEVHHSIDNPRRNYALALTAIEEAQMRYTRGRAIELDRFAPADLDKAED